MSNLIVGASSGLGREIAYEFGKNSKYLCKIVLYRCAIRARD